MDPVPEEKRLEADPLGSPRPGSVKPPLPLEQLRVTWVHITHCKRVFTHTSTAAHTHRVRRRTEYQQGPGVTSLNNKDFLTRPFITEGDLRSVSMGWYLADRLRAREGWRFLGRVGTLSCIIVLVIFLIHPDPPPAGTNYMTLLSLIKSKR